MLLGLGFEDDLWFSAQLDTYDSVPMLYRDGDTLVLRTGRPRRGEATPA
jgi:phosphosulfolactate phosphohydrolase-like enzyme